MTVVLLLLQKMNPSFLIKLFLSLSKHFGIFIIVIASIKSLFFHVQYKIPIFSETSASVFVITICMSVKLKFPMT